MIWAIIAALAAGSTTLRAGGLEGPTVDAEDPVWELAPLALLSALAVSLVRGAEAGPPGLLAVCVTIAVGWTTRRVLLALGAGLLAFGLASL